RRRQCWWLQSYHPGWWQEKEEQEPGSRGATSRRSVAAAAAPADAAAAGGQNAHGKRPCLQGGNGGSCSVHPTARHSAADCRDVTPGLQKVINRAVIYVPGSSHTYIQQNEQYIIAHITQKDIIKRIRMLFITIMTECLIQR